MLLKVLSLWQPWASAIPLDLKRVETRGHAAPASIIGSRIAIQAAVRVAGRRGSVQTFDATTVERDAAGYLLRNPRLEWPYRLPLGAIVATAVVVASVPTSDVVYDPVGHDDYELRADGRLVIGRHEFLWGDYSKGRHAWPLAEVEVLRKPVPFIGGQGLSKSWEWEPAAA